MPDRSCGTDDERGAVKKTNPPSARPEAGKSLVLIPSYNSGATLRKTVASVLLHWPLVLIVLDGSTDGSAKDLEAFSSHPGLTILERKKNGGKGAAVLDGLRRALEEGYTRVLVMDADGQHPPDKIREFFDLAEKNPHAFILGVPIFSLDAPKLRIYGRLGGNTFAEIETLWGGIRDSLFGFRVYPVKDTLQIMERIRTGKGFDFDTEIAVRLYWEGLVPINVPVPVTYPPKKAGGVSHFRYLRDNWLLVRRHIALLVQMVPRVPQLLLWRFMGR
jgi:glycosyltransferase involved in cell wall biosynthesis